MATRTVIDYVDDVTGKTMDRAEAQTIHLQVGRKTYELDISPDTYRKSIEPLVRAAREVRTNGPVGPIPRQSAGPTRPDKAQNKAMRVWWQANQGREGVPSFNVRGRIPSTVEEAFQTYGGAAIPMPDVPPAKEPRKAGTVGREMTMQPPKELRTRAAAAKSTPARKTATAKASPAVPGRSVRRQGTKTAS